LIEDIIGNALDGTKYYTEVRAHRNVNYAAAMTAGNLTSNSKTSVDGVSARVFKDGLWGFSSTSEYTRDAVKDVISASVRNAEFLTGKVKKKSSLYVTEPVDFTSERDFVSVNQKDIIDYVKKLDEYIVSKYPGLASRSVILVCDSMEKLLKTSEGSVSHQINPRACLYIDLSAEANDGTTVELLDVARCGCGYFYDYFKDPEEIYPKVDALYEELMKKREGIFSTAGYKDVIIAPSIAGMIAHEAVGHTVEADLVAAGSVAKGKIGQKVASDLVSIIDFANTALGQTAPLPVYVDDEGVKAEDAVLIKDGILTGYMNNRESAVVNNMKPTGNARAHTFSDEPIIRMRNTAILPGKDKLEDMISSIDDGYYLTRSLNGQADTTGEFMFGVTMGYEIKNGKLGRAIRDTTISGVAFDMLKTVDMLSDKVEWASSGYCGKKQLMPVSDGGPAVKCKVNIGGQA
jgi:TldD protein